MPRRPIRSTLGSTRSDWNEGRVRPFYMGSVQPTITQVVDNHSLKYGYDLRILRENFSTDAYKGGQFFFDGTFTAPASNSSSTLRNVFGRDVAAFLLGIPTTGSGGNASQIDNSINYSVQSIYHGFFIQDDWRVSKKLTLNLGLRYDIEQGLTERYNRILRGFDLGTPSPIEAQVRAAYTTAFNANPANFVVPPSQFHVLGGYTFADENNRNVWEADRSNFQPRVGASYQLNEKTVLRAGFGVFMAPFQIETPQQIGFAGNTPCRAVKQQRSDVCRNVDESFPERSEWCSTFVRIESWIADGNRRRCRQSTQLRSSVCCERIRSSFASCLAFNASCRARSSSKQTSSAPMVTICAVSKNLNFVPRQFLGDTPTTDAAANTFLSATIPNPFRNLVPGGSAFNTATTITRAQSLLDVSTVHQSLGSGIQRQQPLQLASVADQQALRDWRDDERDLHLFESSRKGGYLNPTDTLLEDRISQFDRPHRFTFAGVYELPIGRGRLLGNNMNRVLDAVHRWLAVEWHLRVAEWRAVPAD